MRYIDSLFEYSPAQHWTDCYPIGNGNIGAMTYGSPNNDVIYFNDDRLWSGTGRDKKNSCSKAELERIRRLVIDKRYSDAETAVQAHILGGWAENYLPLCQLKISCGTSEVTDYVRRLNMEDGLHTVKFSDSDTQHTRTSFVSYPDRAFVARYTTNKPVNYTIAISSLLKHTFVKGELLSGCYMEVYGNAPSKLDPKGHMSSEPIVYDSVNPGKEFLARVLILTDGGLTFSQNKLHANGCTYLEAYLVSEVDYNSDEDFVLSVENRLTALKKKGYEQIYADHRADFRNLYNRCTIDLGGEDTDMSVSELLRCKSRNNKLQAQLFNFGRYLTISSSRAGTYPANLQGIWSHELQPPWCSNYTVNINTQMNYWAVETTNLPECHTPLFDLIRRISENGRNTAREVFSCDGWMCSHNSDGWGHASPVGRDNNGNSVQFGLFIGAGGWLCMHLYEHYQHTGDDNFLSDNLSILIDCARFYLDYLTFDEESGYLICNPSTSPENTFRDRGVHSINKCSTMDISIIRELFKALIHVGEILDYSDEVIQRVKDTLPKLLPLRITRRGELNEWYYDYKQTDLHHRHLSHLYSLYPGCDINVDTPNTYRAAAVSLERRGMEGTGWSKAWKINLYARLHNAQKAYECLNSMLTPVNPNASNSKGGCYNSLLCAHPPFQIDGNFGSCAGIVEMLMQSHNGYIELLPALPQAWKNGYIRGLKARGNFTVDIYWSENKLLSYTITHPTIRKVNVMIEGKLEEINITDK